MNSRAFVDGFIDNYDEKEASSKKHTQFKTRVLKPDNLLKTKMTKIADILFMTKTAENPYPLGPHIPS